MSDFCPQAVIFDMDGLLVDSEPVWAVAENAMMMARGKQSDPDIQRTLVGLRMRDFLIGMSRAYSLTDTVDVLSADITARMIALIPDQVDARPGAPELLEYLYQRAIPCAIASSSPMAIIDATVKAQGWDRYFRTHVCGDDVDHGKPAPDIYLEAARRLGFEPAACLALEDSPTGAKAAVAAGIVCYAVPDLSHTTSAAFASVTPDVFESLHAVQVLLEECF
ncbi:MAG: HAD-IA family hydrolase [Chloroflexi bacterium]|nr:HAD-IA family hydrolase [Chloroflexota bacterium]